VKGVVKGLRYNYGQEVFKKDINIDFKGIERLYWIMMPEL